jgi:hypothetical protein
MDDYVNRVLTMLREMTGDPEELAETWNAFMEFMRVREDRIPMHLRRRFFMNLYYVKGRGVFMGKRAYKIYREATARLN